MFPNLRELVRSAVDPTDVKVVNRSGAQLAAPEPGTTDSDDTDPSTAGNSARDATVGREGQAGSGTGHDDVRATRRRHASGWLGRYIGLVIAGIAVGGALLLWFAVSARSPSVNQSLKSRALFNGWHVIYDNQAPALTVVIGAVGLGLLFAAGVALVERVVMDRSRRSTDAEVKLLAPKLVMAETRGVFGGPVTVTVLIPAHNEAASIGATLDSLGAQDPAPNRVIVVADNCTDATESDRASARGGGVVSVGNTHKKAGALNQALRGLLDGLGDNDIVMCMDADTVLDDGFLAAGVQRFTERSRPHGDRRSLLRRRRPRHPRPAPTKRVCPVLPGDPAPARARVRVDRHRIDVPAAGAANRRREPRGPAARCAR